MLMMGATSTGDYLFPRQCARVQLKEDRQGFGCEMADRRTSVLFRKFADKNAREIRRSDRRFWSR
jgi:hypothetical protein